MNAASETWISEGSTNRAINEATGPELLHECQKLNETSDCKVTYC